MYKKKETAIKHLQNGEDFESSNFDLFRDDKEIVLEAVKENGRALQYASKLLRNDKEVVLEAVKQDGRPLEYASNELKNDKEIVLKAVKQNGWALEYVSQQFQNDKEIVLAAIKQEGLALQFAAKEIKEMIGNKNPVEALEKAIQIEKLSTELEKSLATSQSNKKAKLKL